MKKETNVALVTVSVFIATFMTAIEGPIVFADKRYAYSDLRKTCG